MRALWKAAPVLAGALLTLAAWLCLSSALRSVQNRHALNWDSARRAMLNVAAADELRGRDPWGFLVSVAGPETWPTLRLTLAAGLHALAGPAAALAVENRLSLAFAAALFLVLGVAAGRFARGPTQALLVLGVSAGGVMGARALFVHAANGMLEVPSALLTLAATTAWLATREGDVDRPWSVALLGNLLFHVRWQHGLIFGAAVLLTEVGVAGSGQCARAVVAALRRGAGPWFGRALLAGACLLGATCAWVSASGGADAVIFGRHIGVRSGDGPVALGALSLFSYVQFAFWSDRSHLATYISKRVRFLWTWLLTPMLAWLLVPFTWRLRTLGRISAYDMNPAPESVAGRLLFYPRAAWESWSPISVRWLLLALLMGTVVAVWKSTATRHRVGPIAVLAAVEFIALMLLSRRNYQARFLLNLVPLGALAAAAWIPAIERAVPRTLLGLSAGVALALASAASWTTPALATTLSEGFLDTETGDACRALAAALPVSDGVLINQTSLAHRQTCAMWVLFLARERGTNVDVRAVRPRGQWTEVLVLAEGCDTLQAPEGLLAEGPEVHAGPLCGQRYLAPSRTLR